MRGVRRGVRSGEVGRPDPAGVAARWVAIVLAGGGSARLGNDKTRVRVGGVTALDRVLAAVRAAAGAGTPASTVWCVGAERPTTMAATWVREDPPGAGPAAGVAAALGRLDAAGERADVAVVLAGDLPMVTGSVLSRLLAAVPPPGEADGARLVDATGQPQHLLGAYRTSALRGSLARRPDWSDASMRALLAPLTLVDLPAQGAESLDLDTDDDVAAARRLDEEQQ